MGAIDLRRELKEHRFARGAKRRQGAPFPPDPAHRRAGVKSYVPLPIGGPLPFPVRMIQLDGETESMYASSESVNTII